MKDSDLEKYYRQRAPEYEQIYYRDQPDRRAELDAEAVRLRQLATGKRILDVPCGTGYWLEHMAAVATDIVAADLAPEMIAEARRKPADCPVEFVRCSLDCLPFAPGRFDLVALGFWLSHHPRQEFDALFDQLTATLSSDGRIWMIENNPPAEGSTRKSAGHDDQGDHHTRRFLDDGQEFVIRKNYFSEPELRAVFEARFDIERLTYGKNYWSAVLRPT